MTSVRSRDMNACDVGSAPTSSSAIPHPSARTRSTVRSSSAGLGASARSVISSTIRRSPGAASMITSRSVKAAFSMTSGSTLTKTVSGSRSPSSLAPRIAAARHASSSSASRPQRRAAPKSANGLSIGPTGPRASASYATTLPVARDAPVCLIAVRVPEATPRCASRGGRSGDHIVARAFPTGGGPPSHLPRRDAKRPVGPAPSQGETCLRRTP